MAERLHRARLTLIRPFERFFRLEAAGGIVLLVAAIAALAAANSRFAQSYFDLWHTPVIVGTGAFVLEKDLLHFVNDGLMAIFFLLVGLEIKREFLKGELSNVRAATLPIVAAFAGMVVPALIFVAFTWGTPDVAGWGIPMATDIAFALGALALLGRRLPSSLRVFLAAAAIVDDVGAVVVIALFYTPSVSVTALLAAAGLFLLLVVMNRARVNWLPIYVILGVALWLAVLQSGVHATIGGVLLALAIPARAPADAAPLPSRDDVDALLASVPDARPADRESVLLAVEKAAESRESLLGRMEHALVPWVAFGVMPIFAFANAGVAIEQDVASVLTHPVALGIILGLVVGKQLGMTIFPWIVVRAGWATLPAGASWRHIWGVSLLAGIGFTMSLFIAGLGLTEAVQPVAKVGILTASLLAGVAGLLILRSARAPATSPG